MKENRKRDVQGKYFEPKQKSSSDEPAADTDIGKGFSLLHSVDAHFVFDLVRRVSHMNVKGLKYT